MPVPPPTLPSATGPPDADASAADAIQNERQPLERLSIDTDDPAEAEAIAREAAEKLLANPVTEDFEIEQVVAL